MATTQTEVARRIAVPAAFNAVVITAPADVGVSVLAHIQTLADKVGLPKLPGHRVLHGSQVEHCDSSSVAAVMTIMRSAQSRGFEFAICNPTPIVRRYLEIYGATAHLKGRILYCDEQGFFASEFMPFVPPYVPAPDGRWDIYENGRVRSMVPTLDGAVDVAPVNLGNYAVPATREVIHQGGRTRVIARVQKTHESLLVVRRFEFTPQEAMAKLDVLMKLHAWYKGKGFDFKDIDIWQSDANPGQLTHVIEFRDSAHYDQFQTLLKVDTAWRPLLDSLGEGTLEFHKAY